MAPFREKQCQNMLTLAGCNHLLGPQNFYWGPSNYAAALTSLSCHLSLQRRTIQGCWELEPCRRLAYTGLLDLETSLGGLYSAKMDDASVQYGTREQAPTSNAQMSSGDWNRSMILRLSLKHMLYGNRGFKSTTSCNA